VRDFGYHIGSLNEFLSRDWFLRAWTFQETIPTCDSVFLCGSTGEIVPTPPLLARMLYVVFGWVSVLVEGSIQSTLLCGRIHSCRGNVTGDILGPSPGSLSGSGRSLMSFQGELGTRALGCRWVGAIGSFDFR
jgi:hypothetical protein